MALAARPRQADIGEAALLLEAGAAALVERALVAGTGPSSQPGRKTVSNSRPLAACRVMRLTRSSLSPSFGVHDERDVLEEARQVGELLHRADQLLQVLQPPGGVGRAVLLPHARCSRTPPA